MPRGRRRAPAVAVIAMTVTLAGCSQYVDTSPPTGEGRQLALVFLVVLLVPTLLLGGLLAWHHLYDRGDGPRRPPGRSPSRRSGRSRIAGTAVVDLRLTERPDIGPRRNRGMPCG